jgi:hypothetical protein
LRDHLAASLAVRVARFVSLALASDLSNVHVCQINQLAA